MDETQSLRFFAMEYYLLILNRSFEVTVTSESLSAAYLRGVIASPNPEIGVGGEVWRARKTGQSAALFHPDAVASARKHDPGSPAYLALHRTNFTVARSQILQLNFDPRKKWGMGWVPHSGRIQVALSDRTRREFILLGDQNGCDLISKASALGYDVLS
jgi:hypothetical protein